jgi:hypothetical protein
MLGGRVACLLKEISRLAGATHSGLSVSVWNTPTHIGSELNVRVVSDESVEG